MNDLNLKFPSEYTEDYLEELKKDDNLIIDYQIKISMVKYLQKYGLFNEDTRNADAVILVSSPVGTGNGMFYFLFYFDFW